MTNSILTLKQITKNFGGVSAISQIDLEVNKGKILGIIGPNGAGKTTLFNIISGIYKPTSGEIKFFDDNITGLNPYIINGKGVVRTFQNIRLFKQMSILENVLVGCQSQISESIFSTMTRNKAFIDEENKYIKIAEDLLRKVGLFELRYERPGSLPYGQQRKLEIARALASNPKVLMLDEPAAGMNEQETLELTNFIRNLKSPDIALMLIEHDMKLVMNLCDEICVINHGIKIAQGTPLEVRHNKAVIDAYLGEEE